MGRQTSVEGSDVLGFRHEVSKRSFDDSQSVKALSRVTGTTSVAGHSAPEQRSKKETSPTLLVSDSLDEEWWLGKPFFKTVRALGLPPMESFIKWPWHTVSLSGS